MSHSIKIVDFSTYTKIAGDLTRFKRCSFLALFQPDMKFENKSYSQIRKPQIIGKTGNMSDIPLVE